MQLLEGIKVWLDTINKHKSYSSSKFCNDFFSIKKSLQDLDLGYKFKSIKPKDKNIKIAFCFDNNLTKQACVTISSLLKFKQKDNVHYDIYCICSNGAESIKNTLESLVKRYDKNSKLFCLSVDNKYNNGFETRGITKGAYLRLQLHNFLPNIDKIIYCDIDILFQDNLQGIWDMDINDKFFLGVKGAVNLSEYWQSNLVKHDYFKNLQKGVYINTGVLVMNLKMLREAQIDKIWENLVNKEFFYVDQDIINLTCQNKIGYIPLQYNLPAYLTNDSLTRFLKELLITNEELENAVKSPAIIHYAGEKPWDNPHINKGELWYNFVKKDNVLKNLFAELIDNTERNKNKEMLKTIFSISNIENNRKQINLLGLKIKIKRKNQIVPRNFRV